jgi:hypothetical protein
VSAGQFHPPRLDTRVAQLHAQTVRRPLPAAIPVGVETDINEAAAGLADLGDLKVVEMRPQSVRRLHGETRWRHRQLVIERP